MQRFDVFSCCGSLLVYAYYMRKHGNVEFTCLSKQLRKYMSDTSENNSSLGELEISSGVLPQWFYSIDRAIEWAHGNDYSGTKSELLEVREYLVAQQQKQQAAQVNRELPTINMKRLLNHCLNMVETNDVVEMNKLGFASETFAQCKIFIGKLKSRSNSS